MEPGATADVFLLTDGDRRWVAKFAYDFREYFEGGLRASALLAARRALPYPIAAPLATDDGELTVLADWPERTPHPLAVLEFVDGQPLAAGDEHAPEVMGEVCGRVHAALLHVDPEEVGIEHRWEPTPAIHDTWDVGEHGWLNDVYAELATRARAVDHTLRKSVGVWDGPDIRIAGTRVGLIDFGHTSFHPLVYVVANRSLVAAYGDRVQLRRFMTALEAHLPLTPAEHAAFDLYRLVSATIYARWSAAHPDDNTTPWLGVLLEYLRSDLPRVGLAAPTALDVS